MPNLARWLALAALVIVLDQWSKYAISSRFVLGEGLTVTGYFNLALAHNMGAAFSFLDDAGGWQRWLTRTPLYSWIAPLSRSTCMC